MKAKQGRKREIYPVRVETAKARPRMGAGTMPRSHIYVDSKPAHVGCMLVSHPEKCACV